MRSIFVLACVAVATAGSSVYAKVPDEKIKIGILNDFGGADARTVTSTVAAAQMAAEDFETEPGKLDVEIEKRDLTQPSSAAPEIRDWLDKEHVTAVIDVVGSSSALSISDMIRDRNRVFIAVNVIGVSFDGSHCSPTTVQWGAPPSALAGSLVQALSSQGKKTWFLMSGSGPEAAALQTQAADAVAALGGTESGSINEPQAKRDITADLLKAAGSRADVLALGETGLELQEAVAQAGRLGLIAGSTFAAFDMTEQNVAAVGLERAQGLYLATAFYERRNDATRDFARRFAQRMGGRRPTGIEAALYSATIALLHAVKTADSVEGDRVMTALRRASIPDRLLGTISLRADGVAAHDMYVVRVKRPGEAQGVEDVYEPVATVPADQAFPSGSSGGCPAPSHQGSP